MKKIDKELQFRATFEDTKKAQKKLRKKLNELIHENRCLKDYGEIEEFIDLLSDSTFGLGNIECIFWLNNKKHIEIDNLEKFIGDVTDWDKNVLDGDFFFFSLGKYNEYEISIDEIWRNIKSKCYGVFAEAKSMSMRISKEVIDIKKEIKRLPTVKK